MNAPQLKTKIGLLAVAGSLVVFSGANVAAAPLALVDSPLFLDASAPPLNLLVLGRDHKLYYEAYNDHSDLNGDGVLDIGYKPATITYFGYFDSTVCYDYNTTNKRFEPSASATSKQCTGAAAGKWSGDWLNYVTMTRMDALRKVLYGGKRSVDTTTETVLERSHVPQDAHAWAKEYKDTATDGYDITLYTPLAQPASGKRHLFANVTVLSTTSWTTNDSASSPPLLRVAPNLGTANNRAWNWVSVESPVAGACFGASDGRCSNAASGTGSLAAPEQTGGAGTLVSANTASSGTITGFTDMTVRVLVCTASFNNGCKSYPTAGSRKPTGLIQQYGENDTMLFGLLSGSYQNSKSGGVLRKAMGTVTNEINSTTDGTFTSTVGIIKTIDALRAAGYTNYRSASWYQNAARGAGTVYQPGLVTTRPFDEGEFGGMWGNPVAEMMYEGLRYFAGKPGPTTGFDYGSATTTIDAQLGLPRVGTWTDPYGGSAKSCTKPFETVISDVNVSYDSDQLPGVYSKFGAGITGTANDLSPALSVASLADSIWNTEIGSSGDYFIGESGAVYDGAPKPKPVTGFGSIRGLSPEEPTKQGSYYAAAVANYGLLNDISAKNGLQNVQTFVVALASPLPRIEIPITVSAGPPAVTKTITIIPFAKSVGGASIVATKGSFQPTNQIVDFYMLGQPTATGGSFQVNFEDVEAGNDHDMDAIAKYTWSLSGTTLTVTVDSVYAAGGIIQHMGYVISGSNADGVYLEVRDKDTGTGSDIDYFLDTPGTQTPGSCDAAAVPAACAGDLPLTNTRTFTPGSASAGTLKDPLWYAAKWGGFVDGNKDGLPFPPSEWNSDNDKNNPDNYFLVTNALSLSAKLSSAFQEILRRTSSASSASVNSGSISTKSRVYQATFDSGEWTGHLLSFPVITVTDLTKNEKAGELRVKAEWDAAVAMPSARNIFTMNTTGAPIPFDWTNVNADAALWPQLHPTNTNAQTVLEYIAGDQSKEADRGGTYRIRKSVLGDLINSAPLFVGAPNMPYPDNIEGSNKYATFRINNTARTGMIYAGANDGMLHGFRASDGKEQFAYIPTSVFGNLKDLTSPSYQHRYYVDGSPNMADAYFGGKWRTVLVGGLNKGGKGIYALDISNPESFKKTDVLWEYTNNSPQGADLGYTFSQPAIVKLNNDKWAAIFGNGYNGSTGHGVLYIVDLSNGSVIRKLDTGQGSPTDPNGLATPAVVDFNGDAKADFVYAGDLLGNMWKFDIQDKDETKWKIAYTDGASTPAPAPLFTAMIGSNRQPITSRPEVARGPAGKGMVILFGTGRYLELSDKTSPFETQSVYGIFDDNTGADADVVTSRSVLTQQTIDTQQTITLSTSPLVETVVRTTSNNPPAQISGKDPRGWYMDLLTPGSSTSTGERVVSSPTYREGRLIFTTLSPKVDPCEFGGESWLMELSAVYGTRLKEPPVDVNNDGKIDSSDNVIVGSTSTIVSGVQSKVGITPEPGILTDPNQVGTEFKYFAGTDGRIQMTTESRNKQSTGRQSWKQTR